jgi:DNA polymerase-3 subunit epsilon
VESFIAIDFETANASRASACEWGFSYWEGGSVVKSSATLLQPPSPYNYFDPFNVALHGISEEDVVDGTTFEKVLEELSGTFKEVPVIAHNTGFDMSVIRKTCELLDIPYPDLNYYCTLVLARKSFADDPNVVSFKLENLVNLIGVDWNQEHRAEGDATAAGHLATFLMEKHRATSLAELAEILGVTAGLMGDGMDRRCETKNQAYAPLSVEELKRRAEVLKQFKGIEQWDPSGDFAGKHVKFTGSFSRLKADYEAAIVECGGTPQNNVNKKTDFIVEGVQAAAQEVNGGSAAQRKAVELKANGQAIEVLDEVEFLRLLSS